MTDLTKVRPIVTLATAVVFKATGEALKHWATTGERPLDQAHRCFATAHSIVQDGIVAVDYRALGRPGEYPETPFGSRWLFVHFGRDVLELDDNRDRVHWQNLLISLFHLSVCIATLRDHEKDRLPVERLEMSAAFCRRIAIYIQQRVDAQVRICD